MPMNRLKFFQRIRSPSSQRAWIEIMDIKKLAELLGVALLAEGVDRNNNSPMNGRKSKESPSSQRAWIEIKKKILGSSHSKRSPSSQRAWIEI